jgi:hypothetical protein
MVDDVLCVVVMWLLWLVLADGRGFLSMGVQQASISFNGRVCVVLQVWSISSLQTGREEMLVVVYSSRVRVARP